MWFPHGVPRGVPQLISRMSLPEGSLSVVPQGWSLKWIPHGGPTRVSIRMVPQVGSPRAVLHGVYERWSASGGTPMGFPPFESAKRGPHWAVPEGGSTR
jgi:hypothetical protein